MRIEWGYKGLCLSLYPLYLRAAKALSRLRVRAGSPESSLITNAMSTKILCAGSIEETPDIRQSLQKGIDLHRTRTFEIVAHLSRLIRRFRSMP